MGGKSAEKRGVGWSGLNIITEETSYRPLLAVIIGGGSGNDESLNLLVREVFVGGDGRIDGRYVYGNAVVSGEAW